MVKRLLLLLCLLAGGARATITISNDTLLSQIPITVGDSNVTIAGTAVITVDATREFALWSQGANTRLRFSNTGHTVTMGGLRNLGRIDTIGSTDALQVKNRDLIAADSDLVCWGAGSIIMSGNASRTAAIRGISVGGVKPTFMYRSTSGDFKLSGGTVSGFRQDFGSGYIGGLNLLPATNRTVSSRDVYFTGMTFDSCAVHIGRTQTLRGFRMDNCIFNLSNSDGFIRTVSPCDTFYRVQVRHSHNGAAPSGYGFLCDAGSDSTYIYGCSITGLDASGENTLDRGININAPFIKMDRDTIVRPRFGITTTSGNCRSGQILNSVLYGASHEQLHWENGTSDSNWVVQGNLIYGGGARSLVTVYRAGVAVMKNLNFSYNTVVSTGGGKSAFGWDCPAGTGCGSSATGLVFVGNIFAGANASYALADMLLDGYTLTFTEFKNNVIDKLDTTRVGNSGDITVPYLITDSNRITSAFGFVDSVGSDYRLSGSSPILNCGDSTYFIQIFGNTNPKGDPGYYQSYTTGTCGGGSPTPTGACCYNYTCAVVTQAQCTSLGGVYQGDGTSTCSNCTAPSGSNPSPYSKQLKIASLCYYAPWWTPNNLGGYVPAMRDWAANRYAMLITTGPDPTANVTYMKGINPNLKIIEYQLFGRHASDTAALRAICDTLGYNFKEIILHTDTAAVTTTMPTDGSGYGTTQSVTTTADSSPVIFSYWINTQRRVSLNPRDPRAGTVLARRYKQIMDAALIDGIMPDEEQRWTGLFPAEAPILPTDGDSAWARKILNPFGAIANAAYPDSQVSWRNNWAKTLGDSMKSWNKIVIPNGTRLWGAHASQSPYDSGWKVEGRHATVLWGGALLNENHGVYWKDNSTYFRSWMKLAHDVKDSNVDVVLSWIPTGPPQFTCAGFTKPRDKMNFLGFALMCTFPTTNNCNIYFSPKWVSNYNDVYHNWGSSRNFGCSVYTETSDTLWEWSNAWGKYFGVAMSTIDSATSGTDGASQTYKVFKKAFTHPTNGTGDTLGFVAMRFTQGTTYGATSGISVALPGSGSKNWYELIENTGDSAGQGASVQTFWRSTPYTGGSSITILNSQARIFSSDTVLANAGFNQSSTGSISMGDATVAEGGTATFTVTLSQAQSVLTTFNYSTHNGTAAYGTDYDSTAGSKPIGIGQTSTTITVPTTNRSGCQTSRAFTVSITGVSPATLTIIDPTGTGTITDDDCGVTIGKTYKGKIHIEGKVKP